MNWRKSTRCAGNGACIEIGTWVATVGLTQRVVGEGVFVRDSTDPEGPTLNLTRTQFRRLLTTIKEER